MNSYKLLVTVGGSDTDDLIPKILRALLRIPLLLDIQVLDVITDQMATIMRDSDLSVNAGGFTLYELAATGTPSVVLCRTPHQFRTAKHFEHLGTCQCLGLADHVTEAQITTAVTTLLRAPARLLAMRLAGPKIVDGKGLERVVDILMPSTRRTS